MAMDLVEVVSNGLLWSLKNNMNLETLRINILDFLNNKFVIEKELIRGFLLTDSNNNAIMIDYQICDKSNPFKYNEYTKEQNSLMFKYDSCFRF